MRIFRLKNAARILLPMLAAILLCACTLSNARLHADAEPADTMLTAASVSDAEPPTTAEQSIPPTETAVPTEMLPPPTTAAPSETQTPPPPDETEAPPAPTRIAVPRMGKKPLTEALGLLDDAGISYTVREQYSADHPAGTVITVHFYGVVDDTYCHINPAYPVEVVASLGVRYKTNALAVDEKRIYLTFDDGPHPNTDRVLEILDEYDVRATFFTLGMYVSHYQERTRAISDAGHLLACHSYSHDYLSLYASAESVLDEIHAWEEAVVKSGAALPEKICFRFPGGSTTYYMDKLRYEEIFWAITDAGYYAIDWTCANNDRYLNGMTEEQTLVEYLLESTVVTLNSLSWSPTTPKIMLMHDTADETVEALPQILDYLIAQGYTFGTLDELDGYWVFQ